MPKGSRYRQNQPGKGPEDLADATNTLQKVFAEPPNRKTGQLPTEELTKTTEERNEAQRELAAWRAMGVPIDQVGHSEMP